MTLDELVRATPPDRDRYVDFLRAVSIVAVMVGHWVIGLVAWNGGVIRSASAIGRAPGLWLGTWALQVMPVFFFVGGYSNYAAYRSSQQRGEPTSTFVGRRVRRLVRPFAPFLAVWTAAQVGLHLSDTGSPTGPRLGDLTLLRGVRPPGQTIPFGPLWFLAVYLAVVAVSPLTIRLHHRFRWWVPAVMIAGAVAADGFGFIGGQPRVRYLNVAFVLLFPHQIGHFYGDGTLDRWSKRVPAAMMAAGMGALILLTNPWVFSPFGTQRWRWFPGIGHYPRSLLGTDVEKISNAYPPTLCFLAACIWMIGLAVMLREPITRWLQRRRPWKATVAVNSRIMTLFLWHMTAFLLAVIALWPLGLGHQTTPSLRWWAERPLWIAVPAAILAAIVAILGPFENRGHAPRASPPANAAPRPPGLAGRRDGPILAS